MKASNVTTGELEMALQKINLQRYGGNIKFANIEQKGSGVSFRLGVNDPHTVGGMTSASGRTSNSASSQSVKSSAWRKGKRGGMYRMSASGNKIYKKKK